MAASRRGVAPGVTRSGAGGVNPLRSLRFRPVSNRWASRVRLGLPARWAGLLSCRSEVTPFRIHQPEHDGPHGFGIIVTTCGKSALPSASRPEDSKSSSRFPAGRSSRGPPSTGSGTRTRTPPGRTRDFKSLASADFAIPAFDSPVFRAPPAAARPFPGRRRDSPNHRAEPPGRTIGRNHRARTREFPETEYYAGTHPAAPAARIGEREEPNERLRRITGGRAGGGGGRIRTAE